MADAWIGRKRPHPEVPAAAADERPPPPRACSFPARRCRNIGCKEILQRTNSQFYGAMQSAPLDSVIYKTLPIELACVNLFYYGPKLEGAFLSLGRDLAAALKLVRRALLYCGPHHIWWSIA
jgi:hypothetical protein